VNRFIYVKRVRVVLISELKVSCSLVIRKKRCHVVMRFGKSTRAEGHASPAESFIISFEFVPDSNDQNSL
jgi:riboflavin synthase